MDRDKVIEKKVINVNKKILEKYNDSLGWYLTCLVDNEELPYGVLYIGTGEAEDDIDIIYEANKIDFKEIEKFLNEKGIQIN